MTYSVGYKKPPPGFKQGQSGNPAGRPKEPLTTLLHAYLEENGGARKQRIITEIYKLATTTGIRGQIPALTEIYNRIDGKVPDQHSILGLIVHVGDDYARQGLEANRLDLEERKRKYIEGEYRLLEG